MIVEWTTTFLRFALTRLRPVPGEAYKRLLGTFAIMVDSGTDGARQAVRIWLHAPETPTDALVYCLRSAGLPSYNEDFDSPAGYAAAFVRLAGKWTSHARSGTPGGMVAELEQAGFTGAAVEIPDPEESTFWISLPGLDDTAPAWGSFNWGESAWQVDGITPADADLLAGIVHFWQPARSLFAGLMEAP